MMERHVAVLGVSTTLETNDARVAELFDEAFAHWSGTMPEMEEPVRVRIFVIHGDEHGDVRIRHHCPDARRLIVHSAGSVALADGERGESIAYVTSALLDAREQARVAMIEAITYALLCHRDRHPLHAAAIACDGRAVLLAGPSGAGKSTLAYLACEHGIDVLSDDHVWVQSTPILRIWGSTRRARLRADAAAHFRDVPARATSSMLDGKPRLVTPLGLTRGVADAATVCLLARGEAASLEEVDEEAIVDALCTNVDLGFDRFPERHARVARALAQGGGWRLTLSSYPHHALPFLQRMLAPR